MNQKYMVIGGVVAGLLLLAGGLAASTARLGMNRSPMNSGWSKGENRAQRFEQRAENRFEEKNQERKRGQGQGKGQANRGNCVADECLAVEGLEYPAEALPNEIQTALQRAIADEYQALATYEAVQKSFGAVRPFAMISRSEEQHVAALKALFDKYGLTVPENTAMNQVTVPTTLTEACQTGVAIEKADAALYRDTLLPVVKDYPDMTTVFTNLLTASEQRHLPAFERCAQ